MVKATRFQRAERVIFNRSYRPFSPNRAPMLPFPKLSDVVTVCTCVATRS